jgi:hypothetical protein
VVTELAAERALDQRRLEGHRDVLARLGSHRPLDELVKQFLGYKPSKVRFTPTDVGTSVEFAALAWERPVSRAPCIARHAAVTLLEMTFVLLAAADQQAQQLELMEMNSYTATEP